MIPALVAGEVRETLLDYLRTTWSLSDGVAERALFAFLRGEEGAEGIFKGRSCRCGCRLRRRIRGRGCRWT
jgi:hypothetical protein